MSAPDDVVRLAISDGIATISIARPEVRNAVDHRVAAGLERALDTIESDALIRVGIITGDGPFFCSGADLRMISEGSTRAMTDRGGFAGLVERDRTTPLIAAVEGGALAGGFEIVLACDLVVAGVSARFGIPEVTRGLVAGGGGLVRLPHRIPRNVAMEMALVGRPIDATRAYQLGLVNLVVDDGGALGAARDVARDISANPTVAVRESRAVVTRSADRGEDAGWACNEQAIAAVQATADFVEGPRAFLDKRAPRWNGD